jgi:hypothetical protein
VERANAEILRGLKTRTYDCLKKNGANWVNELPSVLWGNQTTPSRATGETPFFLVYRAKACLPPEIIMGVTPGFRRQTECELCTCQDQNSRTQRLHK